ncbi:MAG: cyclic nucleotide-binding domain-containing protein [Sedimenticolaceae bacterium]
MTDTPSDEETARLRALVPLHTLPEEALGELLDEVRFESLGKGKMLFEQGDTDHEHVYLLNGNVALLNGRKVVETIEAGSDTARFPLAHQIPRSHSARAKSPVRIARVDSRRLNDLLARSETVDYQVRDFDAATEDDWMSMLLQSPVLQQVPAANLQRVMMSVEQVEVEKGSDLVRQGDPGDFYYMLTSGRAVVRRDAGDGKGAVELATLGPGDAFGEEALLSDTPRNSTVSMLQDGEVLRLSKADFLDLIQDPLLERLNSKAAAEKVAQGAVWLDLRSSEEFDESHRPGAINLPFESLRYQTSSLALDRHYVLYSNSGGRAMAGAFLLAERGFDVSVLKGNGAAAVEHQEAAQEQAAVDPADDAIVQERVREAERRANELEERLHLIQRDQESVAAERQQHLEQVRHAVDQARRKLLETEAQKREALAAQQQAYAEMEKLTSNLDAVESERASLRDRMLEIEGLDKQLQARLAKAERELIGERERAESANSSLEELAERLNEVLEHREEEREQYARERGELKEEMTALQLDLEEARLDLEDYQRQMAAQADAEAARGAQLADRLDQLQADQAEVVELQQQLARQEEEARQNAEQLSAELTQLTEQRDALQEQLREATEASDHALAQVEEQSAESSGQLQVALDKARAELSALQVKAEQDLTAAHAAADSLRSELQGALDAARQEAQQRVENLQADLTQLRSEHAALQTEISGAEQASRETVEQAQARIAELEGQLHEVQQGAAEQRAAQQRALEGAERAVEESARELVQQREANRGLESQLTAAGEDQLEALQQANARISELEGRLQDASQQAGDQQAALATADAARDQAERQVADLQQRLDAALAEAEEVRISAEQTFAAADRQAQQAAERMETALDQLRAENDALRSRLGEQTSGGEQALEGLSAELLEIKQRLEEREQALATARAEQAELTEALNAASAERDTLQLAVGNRGDEQVRLIDLEKQVADVLRAHESELLAHEQQQHALRAQLEDEQDQRRVLRQEIDRLNRLLAQRDQSTEEQALREQRDALLADVAMRDSEVEELRGVIAEHDGQTRSGQSDDSAAELIALRAELEMVRDRAIRDVAQMREQLAAAETQQRRLHQADGREAISYEAMRQRIESLESSLGERQRELTGAEEARHMLEDGLEDVNRQLDEMRRELEKAQTEADEALAARREAEKVRDQLQQALIRVQEDAEEAKVTDLRDERLRPSSRPIGMASVARPRRWLAGLAGAALLVLLGVIAIVMGKEELLDVLLNQLGQ